MAILDEIDSGLDVDALEDVANTVNGLLKPGNSILMITHYQRLLDYIKPTFVHIMVTFFLFNVKVLPDICRLCLPCIVICLNTWEKCMETPNYRPFWKNDAMPAPIVNESKI